MHVQEITFDQPIFLTLTKRNEKCSELNLMFRSRDTFHPDKAFDQNPDTEWVSDGEGPGAWIQVKI